MIMVVMYLTSSLILILMKFYLIIVQNDTVVTIFSYDNLDTALAAYHTELAYRNESRTSTDCAILNADLQVMYRESYKATAPAPSPEPEEDDGEDTPVEGE